MTTLRIINNLLQLLYTKAEENDHCNIHMDIDLETCKNFQFIHYVIDVSDTSTRSS